MWVCDTKTCVTLKRSAAGRPSLRPRSKRTARPCQRSSTKRPGSPKGPLTRRGANDDAIARHRSRERRRASAGARLLHLLHDQAGRLAHHLLEDVPELLLLVLELLNETREQPEIPLDRVGLEQWKPSFHRDAETLVRHPDVGFE